MSWTADFWTALAGDQPTLKFDMYYPKRLDLRVPGELVAPPRHRRPPAC